MNKSREILKKYWGFDAFRPMQEAIADDAIYGHDVLALLPTGGGKSICFQVPGIAREGITLVISPLIALMQDQVANLNAKGIRAKALISGMSYREIDIALDNARFGALDFLYTSPERLQSKLFIERFKQMNVGLIVVDEAHCISEWGHDFRPSFQQIYALRNYHPEVPMMALTATATQPVREDIIQQLRLKKPRLHEASFERPNLTYVAHPTERKLEEIVTYCLAHPQQSAIVYCQTRRSVKEVARELLVNKVSVGIYHGGLEHADRNLMLTEWLSGKTTVMVATNAFGMGIDKPNVRYVLHYEFPPSLEAYFQEAGRAGRDGNESRVVVYWGEDDIEVLQKRQDNKFPPIEVVKLTYRALCNYLKVAIGSGKDETYHFDIPTFCDFFQLDKLQTYNALKILELNGDLVFSEGVFHPTKVKFAIGNSELYNFQIQHDNYVQLITLLSRFYAGIFDNYFVINEKEFTQRLKCSYKELENQLKQLEKYGVLDISWKTSLPSVTFTHERFPDDYLSLSAEVYHQRKAYSQTKLDAASHYLTSDTCRVVLLLDYFGQATNPCGKCDNCLAQHYRNDPYVYVQKGIATVLGSPKTFNELKEAFSEISAEALANVIKTLEIEKIIVFDREEGTYYLRVK